jgi:hypothetical protein
LPTWLSRSTSSGHMTQTPGSDSWRASSGYAALPTHRQNLTTLGALPTEVCTNITDSLRDIDKTAADAYEQLKALLVSRNTKACWTRAFELLKYPELGDMKPTDLMRQMKALLPTDSRPCTTFMALFLLRLPSEMRDHLIAIDLKECMLMAEYANLLHNSRASCAIAAVNSEYEAAISAVSGCHRWEFSPHDQQRERP